MRKMSKNKKIIIGVIIALLIIVIAYKIIEKSVTDKKDFKFNIENISPNPVDTENIDEKEYSFFGKVIESNALYMVGTNVKITYKATVMDTYPLQIRTPKIEVKSADDFGIVFSNKKPTDSYKIYSILSKTETDYTIYGYDRIVNIKIDGKDYLLKDALLQNKITIDEIIAKANKDLNDKKITGDMYQEGGMIYKYENYTMIKCHSLDGNKDVYIENTKMTIDNVI